MGIVTSLLKHRARLRSEAKAHIKAQIKSAKAQAKEVGRQQRRADKNRDRLLARQEKSLHKQNSRGLKAKRRHERRMAKASLAKMRAGRFNRQNIVRYTAAGRMLAPIALPLLYRGVTFARAQLVAAKSTPFGGNPGRFGAIFGPWCGITFTHCGGFVIVGGHRPCHGICAGCAGTPHSVT